MKPTARLEFFLGIVLLLAVVNTAYLSWRYLALSTGAVAPGTGICSLSEAIDCDKVLSTPEARAFYVPNALLGFGFFFGCLLWLLIGLKLEEKYHHHIIRTLAVWLIVATFFTFRFFWLLAQLTALCPLCPCDCINLIQPPIQVKKSVESEVQKCDYCGVINIL